MDKFTKTLNQIKNLEIQGATNVAKESAKAFVYKISLSKAKNKDILLKEIKAIREEIFKTRPTEPFMRNMVNYLFNSIINMDYRYIKKAMDINLKKTLKWISKCERDIAEFGSNKIKKGYVVYTHCHSSTVMNIFKNTKNKKIKFEVHNTETRPLFQGRKTAKELIDYKIPVRHYVDSAARLALKKADIMIIGADAINSEGKVINKIGSELIAEAAYNMDIPIYICTHSWKFDPQTVFGFDEEIEKRAESEIWPNKPKKVIIDNFAFEKINPRLISGIISELGIFKPQNFINEVKREYNWMFK